MYFDGMDSIINEKKKISIFDLLPSLSEADLLASKLKVYISDFIIKYRKNLVLTQDAFAALCNVSANTISDWESGHYNFTVEEIAYIVKRLGLKIRLDFE